MVTASTEQALKNGLEFETIFYANPKKESPFRFRATHIDGKRWKHVCGVVEMAAALAERYAPGEMMRVRLAGWIHGRPRGTAR